MWGLYNRIGQCIACLNGKLEKLYNKVLIQLTSKKSLSRRNVFDINIMEGRLFLKFINDYILSPGAFTGCKSYDPNKDKRNEEYS